MLSIRSVEYTFSDSIRCVSIRFVSTGIRCVSVRFVKYCMCIRFVSIRFVSIRFVNVSVNWWWC
jgi:hypothetical protein